VTWQVKVVVGLVHVSSATGVALEFRDFGREFRDILAAIAMTIQAEALCVRLLREARDHVAPSV
jgi:hypothetical protein